MNKQDVIDSLEKAIPQLRGKLSIDRIVYNKSTHKALFSLRSEVLVGEAEFLLLKKKLAQLFPDMQIAVRVASPSLAEDFKANINNYRDVLVRFLLRKSRAMATWINDVGWSVENDRILLTCPDAFCMKHFQDQSIDIELKQCVYDIFGVHMDVGMVVAGEREAWVNKMRAERGFSFNEPEEPPVDMARLEAEAAALYGTPVPETPVQSAPAPKKERAPKEAKPEAPRINYAEEKNNPNLLKGHSIGDPPVPIGELTDDTGVVVIEGTVTGKQDPKELRGGETVLLQFAVYDSTSTIYCKIFYNYHQKRTPKGEDPKPATDEERAAVKEQIDKIKNGMRVRVRGDCRMDTFAGELSISVRDMVKLPAAAVREDTCSEKRIELHLHTKMSQMDALTDTEAAFKLAAQWGHPALAITDHGATQAFPGAFAAAKKTGVKLIPGCEGYLCDLVPIVKYPNDRSVDTPVVVLDFETTGLSAAMDRIIEIGAVKLEKGQIVDELSMLCDPGMALKPRITQITGITDLMLQGKESPAEGVRKLLDFIGDLPVAAHNASFDIGMLEAECNRMGVSFHAPIIDTLMFSRRLNPSMKSHKLAAVCKNYGVSLKNAHRAVHDATATALCLDRMMKEAKAKGAETLTQVDNAVGGEGTIGETYHIILLCKTQKGMQNLNHLITESNLRYFYRHPNMPRHLIEKYREGLIIGSACEAGELFQAIANGRPQEEIERIASFYDYLEIQPIGNNAFMLRNGTARDEEHLRDFNRKIVALGEKMGKPVAATGDVHFLHPEDSIYRTIVQAGQGYEDCELQPPLYYKTTQEMLQEFSYLGPDKAREVVIDVPHMIADQVEELRLFPKHPEGKETFQPLWPEAADEITNRSWTRARELYGDPLPEIVQKRLEKELGCIVGYGFSTLYSIAQKLVSKSNSDGYVVGSRGSVGSSFVATMNGITEVNPLPPHYRCDHCHKMFLTDKKLASVGVDLPDANCEICGSKMAKDGFEIPFEVFLGFKGDKVPDIDLNFGSDYQSRAHAYIEELFGEGYVYRAGTISGLAEKTAYGFAAKYLEERGIQAGRAHKERLAAGCEGVKRTTGQHPGGIVVLPKEYDIHQFTAVQHPADDIEGNIITTHYDFRSMHDILVKLDCLGHDDPTVIHMLGELTGVDYKSIPLDDKGVLSLFTGTSALGVTPEDIEWETGTLGIPEFGTHFAKGILMKTKPTTMEELVRISGLSHGTDVWAGNADEIIDAGLAVLSQCFCTRDDIMNYLISMGMENKMSFDIMESVRKGKGVKPEWEAAMVEHNVPEWAIGSLKKIKYMFPRGHAVAYVTMALRVAWFKVYRPQAYYAAYFTIRGDGFDAGKMLMSVEALRSKLKEFDEREGKASPTDKQEETAYRMLLEMHVRGIKMLPVDLYKSDLTKFTIEDGNLRCPFTSVNGMGAAAVQGIIDTRDPERPYLSVEDLMKRAHVGPGVVETLRAQGALMGLPETSQVDLFSLLM